MKKIPTIFVRDWEGRVGAPGRAILDEPHPDCAWVFAWEGVATRKLDGTACLIRNGTLWKRYEVKAGKTPPVAFIEEDRDDETGKTIGWVPVTDGPDDRWHREAFERPPADITARTLSGFLDEWVDGTYELVGPKVQGNPENFVSHVLVSHRSPVLIWDDNEEDLPPRDYDGLREYLAAHDIEGIVWHHPDGRMAKIKGKDFGIRRAELDT